MEEIEVAGFRFYPTEEELVSFYLQKKLQGEERMEMIMNRVIPVVPVYEHEPWDLPKLSGELCHGDTEQWFFFVPRQEREARGGRPNRTTMTGYWKATGSPSYVYSSSNNSKVIGVKKTMVFYQGKAPFGTKTKWKMNEYRAIQEISIPFASSSIPQWYKTATRITLVQLRAIKVESRRCQNNAWPAAVMNRERRLVELRHELSVCRVYVVSGNSRAFDRRPLAMEKETTENQAIDENGVIESSHNNTTMVEKETSSPQSSFSWEDLHYDDEGQSNVVSNKNFGTINGEKPMWDGA
ncbi:hypothetical protein LguiA_021364 [Lonicera macranthoides]